MFMLIWLPTKIAFQQYIEKAAVRKSVVFLVYFLQFLRQNRFISLYSIFINLQIHCADIQDF
jgi:hypothetical protein